MYAISLDLRRFAVRADQQLSKKQGAQDKPGQTLEKAAECLMGLFRVCAADKYVSRNPLGSRLVKCSVK